MPTPHIHKRQNTIAVKIDHVTIGGDAPVVVQTMTNTDTEDEVSTAKQVMQLANAGAELVRITVNTNKAAENVSKIRDYLDKKNCNTPLIGDFHYNGHKLLQQQPGCAEALSKYRINPGNVGAGKKRDVQFGQLIETACTYNKPIRIGVNGGSLDQNLLTQLMEENAQASVPKDAREIMYEAIIRSAIDSAHQAEKWGLSRDKIVLSCKMSGVQDLVAVYRDLSQRCSYALHLGLTEAGLGSKGIVASSTALAILLQAGIGDTIRISLTPEPGADRTLEVIVAQEILQTMGIRAFTPIITACPGCGRTTSTYFQKLAKEIQFYVREQMPTWQHQYYGVENMSVAVMGCVVNGPGESKQANIGISLPGKGEKPVAPVYEDGEKKITLKGDNIADQFRQRLDDYIARTYQKRS